MPASKQAIANAAEKFLAGEIEVGQFVQLRDSLSGDSNVSSSTTKAADIFAGKRASDVNVKGAGERFSSKRYSAKHVKTGRPVFHDDGGAVETPSQLDAAKLGVLVKHLAAKSIGNVVIDEAERALLYETATKDPWCGKLGSEFYGDIEGGTGVKALLDDSNSGGLEIAPIAVDTSIITYPLLNGELFPFVDSVNLTRGRRVEGGAIGNLTLSSGGADGTDIPLFNTASLVSAIDTSIYVANLSVEVGRDFLSDAAVDVGAQLQALIGQEALRWLDEQIAIGDGTTEPEGIFTGSGLATANSDNGGSGPPTLQDYFDLLFGIGKQYRNSQWEPCFISNDTSYARSRGIRVDPHSVATTVNQTPVLTLNAVNSYMTLDHSHRVQNNIPNTKLAFGALKKFRMYRRMGLELRVESGGKTLARANEVLIVARMRFGGQVVDPNAFCVMTDAQA